MAIKTIIAGLIPPPFTSTLLGEGKFLNQSWEEYFRQIFDCLNPLGKERSFQIQNYVTTTTPLLGGAIAGPLSIDDMQFDGSQVSFVIVEFFVQRFHVGSSTIQGGTFTLSYNAKANTWAINNGGPHAGVSFSVTNGGQVQYVSSNISGDRQISKVTWRARTLGAKVMRPTAGWA